MAEIIQAEKGGKGGKKRAKKLLPHMDMTPMVDLMMLLITFFMLTTSLSKSKVMEMILPPKLKDPTAEPPKIIASRTLNILLGPDNKIYWYAGGVSAEEYNNLPPVTPTDYSPEGIRALLLERNRALFRKIDDFKQQVLEGKIKIPQDSVQSDDIVFELRNKEYGAYKLRKRYSRNMLIALLIGLVILCSAVIGPYLNAKAAERSRTVRQETQVEIQLENLDQPTDQVAPPPPPPPPPTEAVSQARYAPPVVVDTLKPEEVVQLMTADQAIETVVDEDVSAIQIIEEVKEEVAEEEPEPEPFVVVEEMPMFPGGDAELLNYISAHTQY
ncbi:MAG: biopolymer transporter ExbD, partial [Bacteroidetes bacterium]|nr:biopolymer transporter ExbD [Bacteroidota bacterium]